MDRLTELREMAVELRSAFYEAEPRYKAALSKQLCDVLREIDELEGGNDDGDPIAAMLAERAAKR